MRKPKIAIIAHNATGAMLGGGQGHVGGVERQTSLTAQWFAGRGYDVSILVYNEGQPEETVVNGVRVISMCKVSDGIPGLRFFHPRTTSLFRAMARADADVYYHNLAEYYTGWAALWCKRHNRAFVYSTAHDFDCTASLPVLTKAYERVLYRYGIRNADRLIVQTDFQRDLMRKSFGLDSIPLPMPCPGPSDAEFQPREFPTDPRVVWVGRAVPEKRLEWFLDTAEQLPQVRFEIAAANIGTSEYGLGLKARAEKIANVRWLGSVKRENMPDVYRGALCLCSTSLHEGFPNTFLESWSPGTPLLTTCDPDNLVERRGMGLPIKSVKEAVSGITHLLSNPPKWKEMSNKARRYYSENHIVDKAVGRFEQVFMSVYGIRNATAGPGSAPVQSRGKAFS